MLRGGFVSTLLFLLAFAPAGHAGRVNNPGGERIPFVKLQSEVWDVVIRQTGKDRARIERIKAQCQGIWVNACASGVDPELREIALSRVFQDEIRLSGDFTYCSTALVSELPEDNAGGCMPGGGMPDMGGMGGMM